MLKWFGQQAIDFITRFRNLVYFEKGINITGEITSTNETVTFSSSSADAPIVSIKNTNSNTSGSELRFVKDKGAAGAASDELGIIEFYGDNSAQQQTKFGHIKGSIQVATDGQEGGAIKIAVASHDGELQNGLVIEDGSTEDEIDVTIGYSSASRTSISGDLNITGGLTFDSVGLTAVQTASESFADNDTSIMTSAAIDDRINAAVTGGDITDVSITTEDDATQTRSSGNASFAIHGGNGLSTTSEAHVITVSAANSSTSAKGVVELATTAETTTGTDTARAVTPDGLKDGYQGSTNVTTLGTIATGTWQGTSVATGYTKHLMHYSIKGYSVGDGVSWEIPVIATDAQSPFEHNTAVGEEGPGPITVQNEIRTMGHVMPQACTLKKWIGWITCSGSTGTAYVSIYKLTPVNASNADVEPAVLDTISISPKGNAKALTINETSFTTSSISAGDIIISAVLCPSGATTYFNTTIEVEF